MRRKLAAFAKNTLGISPAVAARFLPRGLLIGSLWEEMGKHQFEFLLSQGLQPDSRMLDVGCGTLRGGIHFIRYLEPGGYAGIDPESRFLGIGRRLLQKEQLESKSPTLVKMGDFGFGRLGGEFDFALAQSVFTHLPLNDIVRCLINMGQVLAEDGKFFATFFENPQGKANLEPILHPTVDTPNLFSYFDRDPYHYDLATFEWACQDTGLKVEYIGDWNHPRDQKMLLFTRA